jgi:hypothetical protein
MMTSDASPHQGGAGQDDDIFHAILWTDHSPIYMFAYVVCPNLVATAVLSNR